MEKKTWKFVHWACIAFGCIAALRFIITMPFEYGIEYGLGSLFSVLVWFLGAWYANKKIKKK